MVDTEDPTGAIMVKEDLGRTMCMSSEVNITHVKHLFFWQSNILRRKYFLLEIFH